MRSRNCSENPDWSIETRGLTRRFGKITAVDRLDLKVAKGTVCGLSRIQWCRKNDDHQDADGHHIPYGRRIPRVR